MSSIAAAAAAVGRFEKVVFSEEIEIYFEHFAVEDTLQSNYRRILLIEWQFVEMNEVIANMISIRMNPISHDIYIVDQQTKELSLNFEKKTVKFLQKTKHFTRIPK
mgnify:CR=1 FL=1